MQLYPGWSARDNYVGGSFFSGRGSEAACGTFVGTKGALTATLNQASEPFAQPTPGTVSCVSEHQAGGEGLVLASLWPRRHGFSGSGPLFWLRTHEVDLVLSMSLKTRGSRMCPVGLMCSSAVGGGSLIPHGSSRGPFALKRDKGNNCLTLWCRRNWKPSLP